MVKRQRAKCFCVTETAVRGRNGTALRMALRRRGPGFCRFRLPLLGQHLCAHYSSATLELGATELQAVEAIDCIDVRERKNVRSAALARSKQII